MDTSQTEDPIKDEIELYKYWQDVIKECKTKNEESRLPSPAPAVSPQMANFMPATVNNTRNKGQRSNSSSSNLVKDKLQFAQIYSDLIHSGKYTQMVIDLEFSYWPAVEEMFKTRDNSLNELNTRSSQEIEKAISQLGHSHTEATISSLSSRHCQDMERLLNSWNMSIEALKDAQREEFREKLNILWSELMQSESNGSGSQYSSLGVAQIDDSISSLKLDDQIKPKDKKTTGNNIIEPINQITMEESFTINLGSQLKTAHNLRILAVDSLYLCDTQRNRSPPVRTQTAMSLYSHNLSAVVLLVDNHFDSYYGIQHDFAQLCNSLNEFHFDNLTQQLKHIQENVMPSVAGRHNLETGDCYVTRHSNLANVHVVFHLVTDDSLKNCEVNSRHPIMSSLRSILKVAHMFDIKNISIPLLLVDEMDEEILTVNWCLKRAELVLKCVKGFLIEMASLSTGCEQGTIQFLVPKGISEELFTSLASLIPEIFRLANSVNLDLRLKSST